MDNLKLAQTINSLYQVTNNDERMLIEQSLRPLGTSPIFNF